MVVSIYDEDLTDFSNVEQVTVNGEDVTCDAFYADEEMGLVLKYRRDKIMTEYYIDTNTGALAVELLRGKVEITMKKSLVNGISKLLYHSGWK